ncbi:MAG: carboxypeptidase-like regulatory domain-containing protein [Pirellulaceae bacterium]|nr:carboxypeptidase-like regulatory domain-containing protein [Pirellulaceae bacterium]
MKHKSQPPMALLFLAMVPLSINNPTRLEAESPKFPNANQKTVANKLQVRDLELGHRGTASGQLFNTNGQPEIATTIRFSRPGLPVRETQTDRSGRFALTGLAGGFYQIEAGNLKVSCRCWSAGSAPPKTGKAILLVSNETIQRGQRPIQHLFLSKDALFGYAVTTAIVVPILVHQNRREAPAASQ